MKKRRSSDNIWWGLWWVAVAIFFIGLLSFVSGCGVKKVEAKEDLDRFAITSKQTEFVGEIVVMQDRETGTEYLYIDSNNSVAITVMPQEEAEPVVDDVVTVYAEPAIYYEEAPAVEDEPVALETDGDLDLLALVIYQEAGGDMCSDECRQMVGEVALNRVASDRYPDTLYGVLTQLGQYGRLHWTGIQWPERAVNPGEKHAVLRAYEIAESLLIDKVDRLLPEDVIYQAEFMQGSETVAEMDGFYFCR